MSTFDDDSTVFPDAVQDAQAQGAEERTLDHLDRDATNPMKLIAEAALPQLPVPFDAAFPPVFALADMLFNGARSMIPKNIRSPAELVAIILTGQELGFGAMTAMRSLYVVNGKVSMSSESMLAMVAKTGIKFGWSETNTKVATIWMQRWEDEDAFELSFTIEDAKRAGLAGKHIWKSYPAAMLRNRAVSAAVKAYCPDVLMGAYVPEELSSIIVAPSSWSSNPTDSVETTLVDDDEDVIDI